MNLVGLLITPAVVALTVDGNTLLSTSIAIGAVVVLVLTLIRNRKQSTMIG
jgi:hypothetical protein